MFLDMNCKSFFYIRNWEDLYFSLSQNAEESDDAGEILAVSMKDM